MITFISAQFGHVPPCILPFPYYCFSYPLTLVISDYDYLPYRTKSAAVRRRFCVSYYRTIFLIVIIVAAVLAIIIWWATK